jgi:hypothetical protein
MNIIQMIDIIALVLASISIMINIFIYFFTLNKIKEYETLLKSMVVQVNRINKNEYDVITKNIKDISKIESKVFNI